MENIIWLSLEVKLGKKSLKEKTPNNRATTLVA